MVKKSSHLSKIYLFPFPKKTWSLEASLVKCQPKVGERILNLISFNCTHLGIRGPRRRGIRTDPCGETERAGQSVEEKVNVLERELLGIPTAHVASSRLRSRNYRLNM